MKRQDTIEIYVDCEISAAVAWLNRVAAPVVRGSDLGCALDYDTKLGPVIITPNIQKTSFVSVYFDNSNSPWGTDVDCARDAAAVLGCAVRCDPGDYFPAVYPLSDDFLEIKDGRERIFVWHGGSPEK